MKRIQTTLIMLSTMYRMVKSVGGTSETDITLYANYTSIFMDEGIFFVFIFHFLFIFCLSK